MDECLSYFSYVAVSQRYRQVWPRTKDHQETRDSVRNDPGARHVENIQIFERFRREDGLPLGCPVLWYWEPDAVYILRDFGETTRPLIYASLICIR